MKLGPVLAIGLLLAAAGTANASLSLVQSTRPAIGTSSLFNAIGTANFGNQKARLEAAGQTTQQGGNPGNGWFNNQLRSWIVTCDNDTNTVSFEVFASSDWTGSAAMSMTRTPTFTGTNVLLGLDIGARLSVTGSSVTLGDVQFDDGNDGGFVGVSTANATYNTNAFHNNYHALTGTLGDFALRGTAIFPTGSTTGDSMRFFINGIQGPQLIPLPPAAWAGLSTLAAVGFVGFIRRRRMTAN